VVGRHGEAVRNTAPRSAGTIRACSAIAEAGGNRRWRAEGDPVDLALAQTQQAGLVAHALEDVAAASMAAETAAAKAA
jgi:hypothetical protein